MINSICAFIIFSYVLVDTLNIHVLKKIYDKGDSLFIGINISPYILVFKKDEKGFSGGINIDFSAKIRDDKDYFIRFFKRIEYETYEKTREKENKIQIFKWVKIEGKVEEVKIRLKDFNSQKEWGYIKKFPFYETIAPGSFLFLKKNGEYLMPPIKDTNIKVLFTFEAKDKGESKILLRDEEKVLFEKKYEFEEGIRRISFDIDIRKIRGDKIELKNLFLTKKGKKFELRDSIYIKPVDIFSVYEWEDLLDAMNLIFPRSELDFLYKAKEEERKKLWDDFWKKYDKDPFTPHNELEIEFLERFQYVMKNFSGPLKGYKTDRGRIYIKYGPPDFIEDHPYESGTYPYQIWYYITLGKRFLFVDKKGFGDYELTTDIRDIYPQY